MIDLGFAKYSEGGRTHTRCGTPEYRAPEIIRDQGHGRAADWWTLGILIYEMLVGASPFNPLHSESKSEIYSRILANDVKYPGGLSVTARDIIRQLLQQDPQRRLGVRGVADVKRHAFFVNVNWEKLLAKGYPSPVLPLKPIQVVTI